MATTLTSSSSSSSPRCVPFAFRRGGERRARGLPAPPAAGARNARPAAGCGRPLCRAAEVVGGGIRGAFFASLDRCSCVEVRTKHDDSFRMVDAAAEAAPLMRDGGGAVSSGDDDTANNAAAGGTARGSWRRAQQAAAGKGGNNKQRRGGLAGCCKSATPTACTRTVN